MNQGMPAQPLAEPGTQNTTSKYQWSRRTTEPTNNIMKNNKLILFQVSKFWGCFFCGVRDNWNRKLPFEKHSCKTELLIVLANCKLNFFSSKIFGNRQISDSVFFWIWKYLHIDNEFCWGWYLCLNAKLYFLYKHVFHIYTSPQGNFTRNIFCTCILTKIYHKRSGIGYSTCGIMSPPKNLTFQTSDFQRCYTCNCVVEYKHRILSLLFP